MADGGRAIPQAKADDNEDVSWALSTADAMWSRGELGDAIKWVRRAAEAASDAELDARALELAKAAADLSAQIGGLSPSKPPAPATASVAPPPPRLGQSSPPPAVTFAPPGPASRRPSNSPPRPLTGGPSRPIAARSVAPPPAGTPGTLGALGTSGTFGTSGAPTSQAPGRRTDGPRVSPSAPPAAGKSVRPRLGEALPAGSGPASVPGRGSGQMNKVTPPDADASEDTQQVSVPVGPPRGSRRPPRPAEPTPAGPVIEGSYEPTHTQEQRAVHEPRHDMRGASAAEIDAWPTQAISGDEHTEGGLSALVANLPPMRPREPSRQAMDPELLATQAVRVVVWRTADGVRVAPAGTVVSAIACDAVLVALDPTADLSAWLTNKP